MKAFVNHCDSEDARQIDELVGRNCRWNVPCTRFHCICERGGSPGHREQRRLVINACIQELKDVLLLYMCFEEDGKNDIYEHFFRPVLFRTANEESRTDVLIGLHASLEVRTRDDLCGSIFA